MCCHLANWVSLMKGHDHYGGDNNIFQMLRMARKIIKRSKEYVNDKNNQKRKWENGTDTNNLHDKNTLLRLWFVNFLLHILPDGRRVMHLLFKIHIVNNWLDYFMSSSLNRLFRCISKKISKLRVTGLCEGNSPVTDELPAQRASNVENVSIWWSHHMIPSQGLICRWGMYMVYQSTIRQQPKTVLYNISMEKVLNRDNGYDSSIHFWRYCWYFLSFCRTKFSTLGLIQSLLLSQQMIFFHLAIIISRELRPGRGVGNHPSKSVITSSGTVSTGWVPLRHVLLHNSYFRQPNFIGNCK